VWTLPDAARPEAFAGDQAMTPTYTDGVALGPLIGLEPENVLQNSAQQRRLQFS
jgi:hypothetical protein